MLLPRVLLRTHDERGEQERDKKHKLRFEVTAREREVIVRRAEADTEAENERGLIAWFTSTVRTSTPCITSTLTTEAVQGLTGQQVVAHLLGDVLEHGGDVAEQQPRVGRRRRQSAARTSDNA